MNHSLKFRESLAVYSILAVMTLMILHAWKGENEQEISELDTIMPYEINVVVTIEGAVEHPGRYHFKKGSSIKEAIYAAHPLPEADLKKVNLEQKICRSRKIKVPFRKVEKEKKKVS